MIASAPIAVNTIWAGFARPSLTWSSGSASNRVSSVLGSSWVMIISARYGTTGEESDRFRDERRAAACFSTAPVKGPSRARMGLFLGSAGVRNDGDDAASPGVDDHQLVAHENVLVARIALQN